MNKAEIIAKLRKIQQLADRGIPGEKENAAAKLRRLLDTHGLKLEDLAERPLKHYNFVYNTRWDKMLLSQLVHTVTDRRETGYLQKPGTRTVIFLLTADEYEQMVRQYAAYREALQKEFERLYDAFIAKNRIYPASPGSGEGERRLSQEEMEKLRGMMYSVDRVDVPAPPNRLLTD